MLMQILKVFCLLSALGLAAFPAMAQARSSSADLTGVVSYQSKSLVPGATVTAANIATGLVRRAATDADGVYRIPLLPPGVYEFNIEVKVLNPQINKMVTLTIGQTLSLNFEIALGGPNEALLVDTNDPLVEPERTHQAS